MRTASTSQVIAGASVTERGTSRSGTTNGSGAYSIADVPVGNVTLTSVQQFVSGGSSTVLRIDDGSDDEVEWPAGGKR